MNGCWVSSHRRFPESSQSVLVLEALNGAEFGLMDSSRNCRLHIDALNTGWVFLKEQEWNCLFLSPAPLYVQGLPGASAFYLPSWPSVRLLFNSSNNGHKLNVAVKSSHFQLASDLFSSLKFTAPLSSHYYHFFLKLSSSILTEVVILTKANAM